jgi:Protein of unknown function with PCYCGC motif
MLKRGITLAALFLVTLVVSAPWANSQDKGETRVPAYHQAAPAKGAKLPALLTKDQLWGDNAQYPFQTHAYELAAKIQPVIYQQPCYCYCDRMGHKSLHTCFENTHGAQCATCMKELYYAYEQNKQGKTAAQIRKGIMAGDWKLVDLQTAASIN